MDSSIHGVCRIRRTGAKRGMEQIFNAISEGLVMAPKLSADRDQRQSHTILGQGTGLVGAEYGRRTQRLNSGGPASQYAATRYPPGPHGHEYGQDQRDFFWQHRHADRNAAERIKSVLMQSGRPFLLAPPKALPTMGCRIAIAWKAGAEAARAVTAASPWLARAEKVLVLSSSRHQAEDDRDRISAERLATGLRRQGVKVEIEVSHSASSSEAQLLQNKAYDWDADLFVMGAYGHSRIREFVLGGVTEDMLKSCAIPILMFR